MNNNKSLCARSRSLMLSRILNKVFIALAISAAVLLPNIVQTYINFTMKSQSLYLPVLLTLYTAFIPAFAALFSLEVLLFNIRHDEMFTKQNIKLLRILSWCCFAVSAVFLYFSRYMLLSVIVAVSAAFFGMILRVLKNVFAQAAAIKEENDFTV